MEENPKASYADTALVTAHYAQRKQHDSLIAPRRLGAVTALTGAAGLGLAAAVNCGVIPSADDPAQSDDTAIMAAGAGIAGALGASVALGTSVAMRNRRKVIGRFEDAMENIEATEFPTHTKYRHTDGSTWSSPRKPGDSWVITLANSDTKNEPQR